ncbi:MAG: hypothetical protein GY861_28745 [bacterium]|nr:hypothetical protein [bacterium]
MAEINCTETLWNTKNVIQYAEKKLGIELDDWQKEYITHEGNTVVRAGRQSGKSFAESLRVALFALLNNKTSTLIIASVDRQSIELLEKVKSQIMGLAKNQIKGRPTFHKIELKNGSIIRAEPAGQTGYGLRGFTVDKLVADEAHYIPEAVFVAVQPMLATTGGTIDLLSTPRGNVGFFYDCCQDKENFYEIHIISADCPRITDEFLKQQKQSMSKLQFAQEYEAIFIDALQAFFPKDLIDECIGETGLTNGRNYLGVDFAGYGGDQNAFITLENKGKRSYVKNYVITEKVRAWETVNEIIRLNEQHNYKQIGVDDGGLGTPILDYILRETSLKRKTIGLNNASRSINADKGVKKLLKEDMYGNLKMMMEQGLLKFPKDDELIRSLTSIQFEIDKETKRIKIYGKYSHITEGLIRAAWLVKTKGLNIMAFC